MNSYSCDVTREMAKYDLRIRRGNVNVHRDKEIVEKFNQNWVSISSLSNTVQEMEFKSSEGLAE